MSDNDHSKPDCYQCIYRRDVVGSAHSACHHPAFFNVHNDPVLNIMAIMGSVGRIPPMVAPNSACVVTGDPHGIWRGWFNHPFDFDPTWLQECSGFKQKEA